MKSKFNMNLLTAGADPELFLRSRKTGEIISAIPFINEGKENPRDLKNGFKVLHDGPLVEFNIPPSDSQKTFVNNLREGLRRISKIIGNEHELVAQASHVFADKYLDHPDARIFGCSPEYCAWEVMQCQPPDCNTNLRSCGSHCHWGRKDFANPASDFLINPYSKMDVVKMMDIHIGLVLTLIDQDVTSASRKALYGRAGRHRPCEFGLEYRTPSNYWMRSPKLAELVYDLGALSIQLASEGKTNEIIERLGANNIRVAIDKNNKDLARKLLTKVDMPDSFENRITQFEKPVEFEFSKEWGI